jgi:hypothetical protein
MEHVYIDIQYLSQRLMFSQEQDRAVGSYEVLVICKCCGRSQAFRED